MIVKTTKKINHCFGRPRSFLLLLFLMTWTGLQAQEFEPSTSTPYNTVFTHLYFLQPDSYQPELAAMAIDPSAVSDSIEREKRSIQLKQILDAEGLFVNLEKLPRQMDYVDSSEGKFQYTLFPNQKPQIYLIKKGADWYYSPQTVSLIPQLHRKLFPYGSTFLMNIFPAFGQKVILGLAIWQYAGIAILLLLAFVLYYLIHRMLRPFVRRILRKWLDEGAHEQISHIDRLTSALSFLVILQAIAYFLPMLLLPVKIGATLAVVIKIFQVIFLALIFTRLANFFMYYLTTVVGRTENKMDDQVLPLLKKIVHVFIVIGAILQILSLLDVNITALIAGVSIGGLAIALAAQDAVKNFIGSIMIFADRPFQIGDYIVGSGFEGEVVEVGFRTTRIKAIDTSIIAVPNGSIANMNIENKGVRIMRLFNTTIGVTYDATSDQLKPFVEDLKRLIIDHPQLYNEGYYVHVKEMAESSINVMFRAYLDVPGYADELRIKEELIYSIMSIAKQNGLDFAFPSRTIYNQ